MEIIINKRTWSAINLNVTKFNNGEDIYQAKTAEEWNEANEKQIPAWCEPEFKPNDGFEYGKLYFVRAKWRPPNFSGIGNQQFRFRERRYYTI